MAMQSKLLSDHNDTIKSVTFYDEMVGGAPGGTFATVIANIDGTVSKIPKPKIPYDPFLLQLDGANVCFVQAVQLRIMSIRNSVGRAG